MRPGKTLIILVKAFIFSAVVSMAVMALFFLADERLGRPIKQMTQDIMGLSDKNMPPSRAPYEIEARPGSAVKRRAGKRMAEEERKVLSDTLDTAGIDTNSFIRRFRFLSVIEAVDARSGRAVSGLQIVFSNSFPALETARKAVAIQWPSAIIKVYRGSRLRISAETNDIFAAGDDDNIYLRVRIYNSYNTAGAEAAPDQKQKPRDERKNEETDRPGMRL